ncbi:MAG: hypothetical protein KKI08_22895 [Armatimonadetes bacterium]|nr:hypothetical protein [Armatimonadota bacterium]
MLLRACLLAFVASLSVSLAAGQTIEASAVAQSLLLDINRAQALLESNQSPWQDPAARPQPEPLGVLADELPGSHIWGAFKPVDQAVRRAYWLQRHVPLDKDAAVKPRREARELLPQLAAAIRAERRCYNRTVISLAVRQVAQVDNALEHLEYHASLCLLWSMADLLGLWDRQAALEIAQAHLADMRQAGSGKTDLRAKTARRMADKLTVIGQIIAAAEAWQPIHECPGPTELGLINPRTAANAHHFADPAVLGGAFGPWRDNQTKVSGATPLVYDEINAGYALSFPPRETRCLYRCPEYRPWQKELNDYRYGWSIYKNSAAQQKPGCDWRNLPPRATWPGAKGAENAGGL